ncbi:archaellin/type IV pilin N-terminal domain-containing protein [archaeon]
MRKGLSPVVAVVLLIALAVIMSMSIYFWASSLNTMEGAYPDDQARAKPISVQTVECNAGVGGNLTARILNVGTATIDANFTLVYASGSVEMTGISIIPGDSEEVEFLNTELTSGSMYVIMGTGRVTAAPVVC